DQLGALAGFRGLDALHEGARAGAGDGAERLDQFVAAHADAVVLDRQTLCIRIGRNRDRVLRIVAEQFRVLDRLVAQLLAGIGSIGDQLAQEYVAVRIDRVHHHVQEAGDIRLERSGLGFLDVCRHCKIPEPCCDESMAEARWPNMRLLSTSSGFGTLRWAFTKASSHAATATGTRVRPDNQSPVCSTGRSEEHTSELQSREKLVCRILLATKGTIAIL